MISDYFKSIVDFINSLSGGNQMIAGAISLWVLGTATWLLKSVPSKIWHFVVKHMTTQMTITSFNQSFFDLMEWLEEKGYSHKFRRFKITNGKWGSDDITTKGVGYGSHIMWHNWKPIKVSLEKESDGHAERDKEVITLTRIGRSHKPFDDLVDDLRRRREDSRDMTAMYVHMGTEGWSYSGKQPKRPIDSVIIENKKMEKLLKAFKDFEEKEEWYVKHGIPYQLGILLHGPPGTGKTSIIRAIAGYLNKALYVASASKMYGLGSMFGECDKDCILVIEDVDSCSMTRKRKGSEKFEKKDDDKDSLDIFDSDSGSDFDELFEKMSLSSLSDLLNAVDGVFIKHGRILIMTTNHPEKLDPALMRPGRVDISLELSYINEETFKRFVLSFFPDAEFNEFVLKEGLKLTGAELQGNILEGMSCEEIIDKYTVRK
jgi:chaperone BCS1